MITDDDLDRRLTDAGATWRTQHTEPAHVTTPTGNRTRTWLAAGLAAAVVAALAIAVALSSTGARQNSTSSAAEVPKQLRNSQWTLIESNGKPTTAPGTLRFARGEVAYYDGCDGYTRRVVITARAIQVADQDVGKGFGCLGAPGQVATLSSRVVDGTVDWSVTGDRLTLRKPGVGTLVYARQDLPLVGTWQVSPDNSAVLRNSSPLRIAKDGHFSFSDGYGQCGARVEIDAIYLHFPETFACGFAGPSHPSQTVENAAQRILTGKVTWIVIGDRLVLTNVHSGDQIRYVRATSHSRPALDNKWRLSSVTVGRRAPEDITFGFQLTVDGDKVAVEGPGYQAGGVGRVASHTVRLPKLVPGAGSTPTPSQQWNRLRPTVGSVFGGTATWRVEHGRLTLRRGGTTLTFTG